MEKGPVEIDQIVVVGGGDAGLLTALALDEGLDVEITIVDDFDRSVPRVGKSTLGNVPPFLRDTLDINLGRLLEEVKLSWKTTVYFEDWCGVGPFHSPLGSEIPIVTSEDDSRPGVNPIQDLSPDHEAQFEELYYRYAEQNFRTIYEEIAETPGKTPLVIADHDVTQATEALSTLSYQFHSSSFNNFLRRVCRERDIELIDDRIMDIQVSNGWIDSIAGETDEYAADLYVDASGFNRQLMGELENEFLEFDLPVDSAIVTTTEIPLSEIVSATVVTSGDAGWFWQIDTGSGTHGERDLGYVYSSKHISDEQAKREFIEGREEDFGPESIRQYRFDSGVLESAWVGNCVAAGNALGFVEPLQSTALSTHCLLATRLTRLLAKHRRMNAPGVRRLFNEATRATWDDVYNFVSIYYKYNQGSTQFWTDACSVNPEGTELFALFQDHGFSAWLDVDQLTRPQTDLNDPFIYYLIFTGLGLESPFYERLELEVDPAVVEQVTEHARELPDRIEDFLTYEEFYVSFHPAQYDEDEGSDTESTVEF